MVGMETEPPTGDQQTLEQRCLELGMTPAEISAAGDELLEVAILRVLPGRHELSLREVATRADLAAGHVAPIARASGLRDDEIDAPLFDDSDVEALRMLVAAEELMGLEAVLQLLRVASAAVARIGDATISTFFTSAGATALRDDESGVALLEANIAAAALLNPFGDWITGMLVRHLQHNYRPIPEDAVVAATGGIDTQALSIGFADLVESTAMAQQVSLAHLSTALDAFERTAADTVVAGGGRVIKFIGDEVMFRADTPAVACAIGLELVDMVREDPRLPALRVGIAHGDVLTRDGDYYGPVVNLAARVTKLASPDGVVATTTAAAEVIDDALSITQLGSIEMRGIVDPVDLVSITR